MYVSISGGGGGGGGGGGCNFVTSSCTNTKSESRKVNWQPTDKACQVQPLSPSPASVDLQQPEGGIRMDKILQPPVRGNLCSLILAEGLIFRIL